jgi:hypothetical protein
VIGWDTSALVRCYATGEPGYARARNLLLGDQDPFASALIRAEATSAVVRTLGNDRRRAGAVLRALEETLAHFALVPVDDGQLEVAVKLVRKHALRAADAIHLAGALTLSRRLGRRQIRFATADREQAAAARAEGIRVIEPV